MLAMLTADAAGLAWRLRGAWAGSANACRQRMRGAIGWHALAEAAAGGRA